MIANMQRSSLRGCTARSIAVSRGPMVCKAFKEGEPKQVEAPDWVPAQAQPVVKFFESDDVKLADVLQPIRNNGLYKQYAQDYVESATVRDSFGWKKIAETINGRCAMIGFVAGAGAEIFRQKTILYQLAAQPQPVALTLVLLTVATLIPIIKGTDGKYLESLQETYTVPEGWFTEAKEKVNGRAAMLGIAAMLLFEVVTARALL
ncbi:hypothetical protein V8C86DRAFT_2779093 [Haematococcus lacustris]